MIAVSCSYRSALLGLVLLVSACGPKAPATTTTATDDSPTETAGEPAQCAAKTQRLWSALGAVSVDKPSAPGKLDLSLPAGISTPQAAARTDASCQPVDGLQALANPGANLTFCCERTNKQHDDYFMAGCRMPSRCWYQNGDGARAQTPSQLASMVGPIRSPQQALALVALLHSEIMSRPEGPHRFSDWQALPDLPPAYEVVKVDDGYTVRAPAFSFCGCSHHLVRLAFHVSESGCATQLDEPPVPLAWSAGMCVD